MKRADQTFSRFDIEHWILERIRIHCGSTAANQIIQGDTTFDIRRERIREAIIGYKLDAVVMGGERAGIPDTYPKLPYAEVFNRFYGGSLHAQPNNAGF